MTIEQAENAINTRLINAIIAFHVMERCIMDCGNDYLYKQYFGIKKDSIHNLLTSLKNGLETLRA